MVGLAEMRVLGKYSLLRHSARRLAQERDLFFAVKQTNKCRDDDDDGSGGGGGGGGWGMMMPDNNGNQTEKR